MLIGENLRYRAGGTTILEDVSFRVDAGEMVVLCGPNGAGKSTLMRLVAGEIEPEAGSVELLETNLRDWNPRDLARTRAKLSQESSLTFSFRVREVVEMGRFPHDGPTKDTIIDACMERVGIGSLADRDYLSLSGGEKQRVHMARVLAQLTEPESRPKLLLLDEPTSALDLHHQEVALALASRLCQESAHGVLVILHDLNLAAAWADRILLLKQGRIVHRGKPDEVMTEPILREVYEVDALVLPHPKTGRPIVTIDRKSPSTNPHR